MLRCAKFVSFEDRATFQPRRARFLQEDSSGSECCVINALEKKATEQKGQKRYIRVEVIDTSNHEVASPPKKKPRTERMTAPIEKQ